MVSHSQRKISEQELRHLYEEELLTDLEIASILGCTKQGVYLARKKFGIKSLSRTERNSRTIEITDRQEQILRGSLLGDAHIETAGAFDITHGEKQLDYLNWLSLELQPYFSTVRPDRHCFRIRSRVHTFGKALRKEYYPKGTKTISKKTLNKLTPLSLAIWFCDDGQILPNGQQSRLATCSFSKKENKVIEKYLKREWDIDCYVANHYGYEYIFMNRDGTNRLVSVIRQHIPESMYYKLGGLH